MKKALSFALALVLVVSLAAPTALAASPTAPVESATTTAPLPVVVPSASDDVALVATNDVAKLPEGAREVLVEAQNALKDAVPEGMKAQYFLYVDVSNTSGSSDIVLKIDNISEIVVKQFIDGKWVELEATINPDGTVSVKSVVSGPIAIFTK